MICVIDSCALINLRNADALEVVSKLKQAELMIGPLVLDECGPDMAKHLKGVSESIRYFADDPPLGETYLELLSKHKLGRGETEALAIAKGVDYLICTDDRKARSVATRLYGQARVVGSLRLLRWCVEGSLLDCAKAFAAYLAIKTAGGFVPSTERDFFCAELAGC